MGQATVLQFSHTRRRSTGVVMAIIALTAALVTSGCRQEQQASAPRQDTVVEVVTVTQKDVPIYSEWVGALDGSVNAVIRPQVTGYLIRQNYREGEAVSKGQVLFEIDPRNFQAALRQAKAQLTQQQARHDTTKANLARVRPLAAKNAVSQKDLDDAVGSELTARASVEAARAVVEEAQLQLDFTKITSPVDGVAGIAKTQLGNLVSPNMQEELTSVSCLDPIKVYFNISEQEYLNAMASDKKVGQIPLELILANDTIYPYSGKFALADRHIDPTTGTLKIGAIFPNKGNMLRPGMYGRIRAMVQVRQGALLVPQRSVTELQGKYMVTVIGPENKVDIRPVKVGERIASDWLIAQGLQPGEQVVAEGLQKVRPGMTVSTKPFSPAGAATSPPAGKK